MHDPPLGTAAPGTWLRDHLFPKPQIENHRQHLTTQSSQNRTNFRAQRRTLLGKVVCPKAGLQLGRDFSPRQADLTRDWADGLSHAEFQWVRFRKVNSEHMARKNSGILSRSDDRQDEDSC